MGSYLESSRAVLKYSTTTTPTKLNTSIAANRILKTFPFTYYFPLAILFKILRIPMTARCISTGSCDSTAAT